MSNDSTAYLALNAVGAGMLGLWRCSTAISASRFWEGTWAVVSAVGLVRRSERRRPAGVPPAGAVPVGPAVVVGYRLSR